MTDRSKTVVLLIDWDNLQICHSRDAPGTELDLQAVIALAQSYGTLVSARAYAEWNLPQERLAVYKAGIEPVFAPVMRPEGSGREGKSLADTVMVADGVDLLWTVAPDVFVLVTSDKDMIPLARIAKQRGAAVVILGSDLTAIPLVELSNVFITYRQLVRELDRTTELDAPSGRSPARERRPAVETRRPTSEPYTGRPPSVRSTRGRSRPAEVPPAAIEAPAPTPAALPAAIVGEESAAAQGENATRRRRRRGGRSRGRGVAGSDGADSQTESAAAPAEQAMPEPDADIAPATESPRVASSPLAPLIFREFGPPAALSPLEPAAEPEERETPADASPESVETPAAVADTAPSTNGAEGEAPETAPKPVRRRRAPARRTASAAAPSGD